MNLRQLPPHFWRTLAFSQLMAVIWWGVALFIRLRGSEIPWFDQIHIFRPAVENLHDPLSVFSFFYPPWLPLLLLPFYPFPLEISALLQLCLYFALLTGVVYKFKGSWRVTALALTSYVALDASIQLNVDWVVLIGLLVPAAFSAPFLLLKPQLALGYYVAIPPRRWLPIGIVAVVTIAVSLLIWQGWINQLLALAPSQVVNRSHNTAPMAFIPAPISLIIGAGLAYLAFRRKDPPLAIIAWVFFTPYIGLYSLLLLFAMIAIRSWRLAVIIHICMWVIYGGAFLLALLR